MFDEILLISIAIAGVISVIYYITHFSQISEDYAKYLESRGRQLHKDFGLPEPKDDE